MKKIFTLLLFALPGIVSQSQNCRTIIDSSFGNGGIALGITTPANSADTKNIVVQPDGKILQLTNMFNGSNNDFILLRYNSNGSLDASFGSGGRVITSFGQSDDNGRAVALQADGKIVVTGNLDFSQNLLLVRYNANGSLDSSFGSGGKITSSGGYYDNNIKGLSIQPDGKIIVTGFNKDSLNVPLITVLRFNANGIIDSAFGKNGKILSHFGHFVSYAGRYYFGKYYYETANAIALQADGKILMAGTSYSHACSAEEDYYGGIYLYCKSIFALARYHNDGSPDTTFGNKGIVLDSLLLQYSSFVAVQPDGKIIVTGKGYNNDFIAERYNSNGSLDNSFGTGGKTIISLPAGFESITVSSVIQPDGKIVLSATVYGRNSNGVEIARLNNDGSADNTFYGNGKVIFHFGSPGSFTDVTGLALQNDKLIAGGDIRPDGVGLVRLSGITPPMLSVVVSTSSTNNHCAGDSVKLSVDQTGLIQWNKDGVQINGANDTIYFVKSTGSYTARVININGCGESLPVNIFINTVVLPIPTITANSSLNLCPAKTVILSTNTQGYLQWYNKGVALAGANSKSFNVSDSGSYSVSVINNYGCQAFSSPAIVSLKNNPLTPFINAHGPLSFCVGQTVVLSAGSSDKLQWNKNSIAINGATDTSYTAATSGAYTVTAINIYGCSAVSSAVTVSANELPKPPISWDGIKFSTTSGYARYQWYYNDTLIAGATASNYQPVKFGWYKVNVTDNNNCSITSDTSPFEITAISAITVGDTRLRYYPNPANTTLYIDVSQVSNRKLMAEVYDLVGRKLLQQPLKQNQNQLTLQQLPSGVYQLMIYNDLKKIGVKLMVIK